MKYKLLIKTFDFVDEFAQFEIEDYFKEDFNKIGDGFYQLNFQKGEEKKLFEFVYNLVYFSRVIENVYLKVLEFPDIIKDINLNLIKTLENNFNNYLKKKLDFDLNKLNNIKFEVDAIDSFKFNHTEFEKIFGSFILQINSNLKVDLDNYDLSFKLFSYKNISYLGIDLIGFNLTKRDYKINNGVMSLNSVIPNYCFYLLGIDEQEKNYSIIDPISALGDIVIEASYFNPRLPLNQRIKNQLPIRKIFNYFPPIVKLKNKPKLKLYSIVQNNKVFKNQRENMNFAGINYKLSQYNIDWLDVKFKEAEIDFLISQIPEFIEDSQRDSFLKEFFYQIEFIFNQLICIISKSEIDKKYFKKEEFEIIENKLIYIGKQKYYIYVLG